MELFRVPAASTYIAFPMITTGGDTKSGLTITGSWAAWADHAGQGLTAGNGFRTLSGAFPEIGATGVYGGFLATTELPAASPFVMLRFVGTGAATQYLLIRTASTFANVTGINQQPIAAPVTAGYMPVDVKQTIALTSMADNSIEKSLARVYFATQYVDAAISTRSAPATGQTVNVVDTGAITNASFAAGAIDASAIAANAIGASEIADGAIDAGAIATDAVDADALAADAIAEIADAVWDEVIYGAHQTDNTAGKVMQRIYHATDYLNAAVLTIGSTYADDILGRTLTRGASGGRTVGQALMALRNKVSISAGTLTVTSNNDTTTEWTATIATESVSAIVTSIDPA